MKIDSISMWLERVRQDLLDSAENESEENIKRRLEEDAEFIADLQSKKSFH